MFADLIAECVGLPDSAIDDELRSVELASRELEARRAALVAVGSARKVYRHEGHHGVRNWVRATCNSSRAETTKQVRLAALVDAVPAVGDALLAGRVGLAQVHELGAAFANPRVSDYLGAVVPILLDHAEHLPFDDYRVCVRRWVMLADLDGAYRDMVADVDRRAATVTSIGSAVDVRASGGDGLRAERMIQIFDRFVEAEFRNDVEARRSAHGDDAAEHPLPRTAAQRRFDALAAIFDAAVVAPADGVAPEPIVNIFCDAATADEAFTRAGFLLPDGNQIDLADLEFDQLSRIIDELMADPARLLDRRCETESGIPIHPVLMLQASLTGYVRRQVMDSKGVVVDQGTTVRLFRGSARTAARMAARHCGHNGCDVPARFADVDHMDEWVAHGGVTDQRNADIRCGKHDRFKHRARWRSRRAPNGRVYNIRPDGTIVLPAGERPPDLTADELDRHVRQRLADLVGTSPPRRR